jgi:hypothetical protein
MTIYEEFDLFQKAWDAFQSITEQEIDDLLDNLISYTY